jgi:hypothetical protein
MPGVLQESSDHAHHEQVVTVWARMCLAYSPAQTLLAALVWWRS